MQRICDMHSHVLPEMDDGAKSIDMSLEMLRREKADGVNTVCATPHFYRHNESIASFVSRRKYSYESLMTAADKGNIPGIVLGAEVYFTPSLAQEPDIDKLFIGDTEFILIELPYQQLSRSLINSFYDFYNMCNCKIIIAHVERYLQFTDFESISQIMLPGVVGQVNCGSLFDFTSLRNVRKLVRSGYVSLLGTDCHNISSRVPNMAAGIKKASSKLGKGFAEQCFMNSAAVLDNLEADDILPCK